MSPRRKAGPRPLAGLLVFLGPWLVGVASGGTLDGRFGVEMEYLGESYFSEQRLSALDLDLPVTDPILFLNTTRFSSDTWLPGQKLELTWRNGIENRSQVQIYSRTAFNQERFSQDLEFVGEIPGQKKGRWLFRLNGSFRDDKRSLVGHGDWITRVEMTRELPLRGSMSGGFRIGWDHSRTRGDSVSYLYDFDVLRARLFASGGGAWLPGWESWLEGATKTVPRGEPGSWQELRLGGAWRKGGGANTLFLNARLRDYDRDLAVGRDHWSVEVTSWNRLFGGPGSSLNLEAEGTLLDYAGFDELYFDAAELVLRLPYRWRTGGWALSAGPTATSLSDLQGMDRAFRQWTLRTGINRLFGLGGFGDLTLEGGYRDYRAGSADVIEVSSLSTSILRSDYWVLDLLALVNVPFWNHFSIDLMASSSWELHTRESERIQVTFANLGVSRTF